ncbi:Eco57I restriction-modification methylase domain-containing protein [Gymnodinialimonas hymeniacidonis]|uniref:Eco57I restriction-modification methylase domain-containing protein n=1 Tax=Gymnodinialimonas hymeniacidonis TaxID=3126508 RepID=UPI0034C5DA14
MTKAAFALRGRNPDVLSCIANLSNDEVFTPPEFSNRMLDTLAEAWAADNDGANIWADPSVRFLDPCTKSGVFLREITKRLIVGLEPQMPELQARVDHILTRQVYGIGITELTAMLARRSLYCSKHANGPHSISRGFNSEAGNIWFERVEHNWNKQGKCTFCGASRSTLDRGEDRESHAYAFIHTNNIRERVSALFGGDMQFDVIVGNPPYQLASDGGTRDVPIYQHFVEQAKALQPRYLSMVIPSRWMATGLGLNDFRNTMLNDTHLKVLVDYTNAAEVFSSVGINGGACYFLWDAEHDGQCMVSTVRGGEISGPSLRDLNEFDVLVRDDRALDILRKTLSHSEPSVNTILARDKEFGWTSNFDGFHKTEKPGDVPLYYIRKMKRSHGFIEREKITKSAHLVDTWKLLVPAVGSGREREKSGVDIVLGPSQIAPNPSVCTQSFLFFYVDSQAAAESIQSYYKTRFFRFLVSLRKITQHATHGTYSWVPMQSWDRHWTDEALFEKYAITSEEQSYIEALIRPME